MILMVSKKVENLTGKSDLSMLLFTELRSGLFMSLMTMNMIDL